MYLKIFIWVRYLQESTYRLLPMVRTDKSTVPGAPKINHSIRIPWFTSGFE